MILRTLVFAAAILAAPLSTSAAPAPELDNNVVIGAPNATSEACTESDFGAVQIRIGLFATLAACYREVEMHGNFGTAFVTVPREFEGRSISALEFDSFRQDVKQSEDHFRTRARSERTGDPASRSAGEPIPLGVFDYTRERVGYAYAYSVTERGEDGTTSVQTMMRTESFVLVNNRVILLMLIAPVADGEGASVAFDLSENWAKAIIKASQPKAQTAQAPRLN
jgi:hypothetical protein